MNIFVKSEEDFYTLTMYLTLKLRIILNSSNKIFEQLATRFRYETIEIWLTIFILSRSSGLMEYFTLLTFYLKKEQCGT